MNSKSREKAKVKPGITTEKKTHSEFHIVFKDVMTNLLKTYNTILAVQVLNICNI